MLIFDEKKKMIQRLLFRSGLRGAVENRLSKSQYISVILYPKWDEDENAAAGWLVLHFLSLDEEDLKSALRLDGVQYVESTPKIETWYNTGVIE